MSGTIVGEQVISALDLAGTEPPPVCPYCGGKDLARAGTRKLKAGVRQLYRCNGCFRRFSNHYQVHLPKLNACPLAGLKSYLLRLPEFIDHTMFESGEDAPHGGATTRAHTGVVAAPRAASLGWVGSGDAQTHTGVVAAPRAASATPSRASQLILARNDGLLVKTDSPISKLAAQALQFAPRNRDRHPVLEQYFLACDRSTIAVEVPVYFMHKELGSITGHIDILQFSYGKLWILDYKPDAKNEKEEKVITQLSLYATALKYRAGIDFGNVVCAYFDDSQVFEFEPVRI